MATIPRIYTNQQAINAAYYAAQSLDLDDWALLKKTGLDVRDLAQDRQDLYQGPPLDTAPELSDEERAAVRHQLLSQLLETAHWSGFVEAPAGLNLRTRPGGDEEVITVLSNGSEVQVLDDSEDWLFVVADGEAGYVHRNFVARAEETPSSAASSAGGGSQAVLGTWVRYKETISRLSEELGIDPAVAVAVLVAESGGDAFGPDGRPIIRFENHVFYNEWGKHHEDVYRQHFQMDETVGWLPGGHRWRPNPDEPWRPFHGNQEAEWEVFDFARTLDAEAACRSISMGAPQIMGFNHHLLGYESAQEMLADFETSEEKQIEGFFRYVAGDGLVEPLRRRDYLDFARGYNGPGQAEHYRNVIERYTETFNRLVGAAPRGVPTTEEEPVMTTMADESGRTRTPFPLSQEQLGGKSMQEADRELYEAWRTHIMNGFENNNEMFHRILNGFMNPYYTTIWMYRILFAIGILAFITAGVMAYVLQDNPTTAVGTAAVFGGLSAVSFLSYFISRPMQALEENLQFITWLGIVYNTYWTRLAYTMERETFHADVEDATNEAIKEIERIIEKHASLRSKRPDLRT